MKDKGEALLNVDKDRSEEVAGLFKKAARFCRGELTDGVPDWDGAIDCYKQAVAAGSVDAMIGLGDLYEKKGDYENVYYWYNEAAVAGSAAGIFNVAWMHHNGRYVKQDYKKAKSYFTELYKRSIKRAAFFLGFYAEQGYDGPVDFATAIRYYREGFEYGDPMCANNLGAMYCRGTGVEKDTEKGFQLFLKAYNMCDESELNGDICANLAQCYEKGVGTDQDLQRALELYREGAELGSKHCEERCERVEAELAGKGQP